MSAGALLQLLCFSVGGRTFACDIMGIQEILRNQRITPVPHSPPHVAGVVNLRGALIPVVDLRWVLLGQAAEPPPEDPKLVVVRAQGKTAGLLVDQVLDVAPVPVASLAPAPGANLDGDAVVVATFQRATDDGEVAVLVRLAPLVQDEVPPARGDDAPSAAAEPAGSPAPGAA